MEYNLIKRNDYKQDSDFQFEEIFLSPIEQILINRGMTLSHIQHYFNLSDEDILSPTLVKNVKEGAKMLISHINKGHDIFIQVDSDCDGYTSSALLINYLYCLFPSFVLNHICYRVHEGKQHGLIVNTIPKGVKLVIAPDSSSNDYEQHAELAKQGIDVLVIDHHEAEKISENACVINNQLCDYPTKSLSGVGMVYKFCCYLDELLNVNFADEYLDLVALGLIGDMMDLRDFETKRLVDKGLNNIKNPFFAQMTEKLSNKLSPQVVPFGVSFYIAPQINATVRMGTTEEKILLFESMLDFKGNQKILSTKKGHKENEKETISEQVCRNCTNIKNRQTRSRDKALEIIEEIIEKEGLLKNKILFIRLNRDNSINVNLSGLIANQLMAKYQRPVLILSEKTSFDTNGIESISWEGSGRGYEKSKFNDFKKFLNDSGYFEFAEGHANAFGAKILDKNVTEFIQYSNKALKDVDFSASYLVDFIFNNSDFKSNIILELAKYKSLWGQGIDEPMVAISNIRITKDNLSLMSPDKNPTLKISLNNGVSLIKFKSSREEYESLCKNEQVFINVVGKCEENCWNGNLYPQILVEDYEITKILEYYF